MRKSTFVHWNHFSPFLNNFLIFICLTFCYVFLLFFNFRSKKERSIFYWRIKRLHFVNVNFQINYLSLIGIKIIVHRLRMEKIWIFRTFGWFLSLQSGSKSFFMQRRHDYLKKKVRGDQKMKRIQNYNFWLFTIHIFNKGRQKKTIPTLFQIKLVLLREFNDMQVNQFENISYRFFVLSSCQIHNMDSLTIDDNTLLIEWTRVNTLVFFQFQTIKATKKGSLYEDGKTLRNKRK